MAPFEKVDLRKHLKSSIVRINPNRNSTVKILKVGIAQFNVYKSIIITEY